MRGFLVLEDKTVFEGTWVGNAQWTGVGEVVFNTSMQGYQEILTDPSYFQQIIVMTAPEQGNYGVMPEERESAKIWAEGFVCSELNSAFNSRHDLQGELGEFGKGAIRDIDTRALTLHLRSRGTPWGAILPAADTEEAIKSGLNLVADRKKNVAKDWVHEVSVKKPEFHRGTRSSGRVAVYDLGCKRSIIEQLKLRFAEIALFNSQTEAEEILKWEPHGLVLTNGPGNPEDIQKTVPQVKKLLGRIPILGICMGHQVLALSLGAKTFKLKFGHRGSNHPVKNFQTGQIYMTAQNHGYAVDKDLPSEVKMSQINLYDDTIEGIEASRFKAWSVQYHPEAGPGPHDSRQIFDHFAGVVI